MSPPFAAPQRANFWQKLGPGGAASLILALGSGALLLGIPMFWQFGRLLQGGKGDEPESADAILVLGRRLQEDRPTDVFEARLQKAESLWRAPLAPRVIIAGGTTGEAGLSEAEAGERWLGERGLPLAAILREDRSQHTLENLFNVRELMRVEGWGRLILVSDPLHLPRAAAMARGLGLNIRCVPAEDPRSKVGLRWWSRALLESFLLHWYHTGMLYSRVIGSRQQLNRVT
jgi:uncharacterized SAM-binding protein YcdF (DUF218 family)